MNTLAADVQRLNALLGARERETVPVAVIVVGRNYGRYLGDALDSIERQNPAPREVVYVDNASTDNSVEQARQKGVRTACVAAKPGNICACRNRGAALTTAPYLLFLDADDVIPQGYVKALVDVAEQNERYGVIFPRARQFGLYEAESPDLRAKPIADLTVDNFMVCTSLIRRKAFDAVGGFGQLPMFQDWDLWLRIRDQGWLFKHQPEATLHVRTHSDSMTSALQGRIGWYQEILSRRRMTVFTPFSPGKEEIQRHHLTTLDRLGLKWENVTLFFYDNTCNPAMERVLKDYLASSPARAAVYHKDETHISFSNIEERAAIVPERMAEIWMRAAHHFDGDFLLSVEDDVDPIQENGARRLFEGMAPDVGAVTGAYYSRPLTARTRELALEWFNNKDGALQLRELTWYPGDLPKPPSEGLQTIGASGLGFLLLRRGLLDGFEYDVGTPQTWRGQDFGVCRRLKEKNRRLIIHWGLRCRHWYSATEFI